MFLLLTFELESIVRAVILFAIWEDLVPTCVFAGFLRLCRNGCIIFLVWCKVWATDCFEKLIFVFKVLSALYSAFSTTLPFVAEYSFGENLFDSFMFSSSS